MMPDWNGSHVRSNGCRPRRLKERKHFATPDGAYDVPEQLTLFPPLVCPPHASSGSSAAEVNVPSNGPSVKIG